MKLKLVTIVQVVLIGMIVLMTSWYVSALQNDDFDQRVFVDGVNIETNSYIEPDADVGQETFDMEIPTTFEEVASDGMITLFLERRTMAIAFRNETNGYVWYSYDVTRDYDQEVTDGTLSKEMANQIQSGIWVYTYNVFNAGLRTLLDDNPIAGNAVRITYQLHSTGFVATVDFTVVDIRFDVEVSIEDSDIVIEVPYESIEEYNPDLWTPGNNDIILNELVVYPFLGGVSTSEDGYVVFPDGNGALVELQDTPTYKSRFSRPIYGLDEGYLDTEVIPEFQMETVKPIERISLPIYGLVTDLHDAGLLVISEQGDVYGTYHYVSKDLSTEYYQSYFSYNYRTSFKQYQSRSNTNQFILGFQREPNRFDVKQRYVVLDDDANYVGVAKAYRNYLEEQDVLQNLQTMPEDRTRIEFLASDVSQGVFYENLTSLTSYQDVFNQIKRLEQDGFGALSITVRAFDNQAKQYRFEYQSKLGSRSDLRTLVGYTKDQGYHFDVINNLAVTYEQSRQIGQKINRTDMMLIEQTAMYDSYYVIDPSHYHDMLKEDIQKSAKYDIHNIALEGFTESLFTSTTGYREYRFATDQVSDIIEALEQEPMMYSFVTPDAFLLAYTDQYYDMPIVSSSLLFADATIPLVSLVLSGYIPSFGPAMNYVLEDDIYMLRLIEFGVYPSYILTSATSDKLKETNQSNLYISNYENLRNRMIHNHHVTTDAFERMGGLELLDHRYIDHGLSMAVYHGTTIYINYTDQPYTYGSIVIPAEGYVIQ
jgi:hypothetical protein